MPDRPKRPTDWVGLVVRSRHELVNGLGTTPAGTRFFVRSWLKGLALTAAPCDCCGFQPSISRVEPGSVDVVGRAVDRPDTRNPHVYPPDRWWELDL